MSAEGWGEFPIIVEIFVRNSGSVKLTHYLKLNAPERYVVSETLDVISVVVRETVPLSVASHIHHRAKSLIRCVSPIL